MHRAHCSYAVNTDGANCFIEQGQIVLPPRLLDLHWDSKTTLAYKQVPEEVWRRLCCAPNPTTYWEDGIAEEYPKGVPMKAGRTG